MSRQLALSSFFSVLALASLCLATTTGDPVGRAAMGSGAFGIQAEIAPGLVR